ncbi:MAG: type III secretion system stator protein SctL [Pyrinomonadaceae bacterium]
MMPKNIIKQTLNGHSIRSNLVKNRVFEAQAEAREIIAKANETSTEIINTATREAEILREEAYAAGKAEAATEFTETIAAAYEMRETALREVEQDVLKLSIKLAEKIIGREIKSDKQTIADTVATAMRNVRQQERLIIRVNPLDFPNIQEFKNTLSHSGRAQFLDIEPDPKITSGGCIIESEVGTVDARLETQLKILERTLLRQSEHDATER